MKQGGAGARVSPTISEPGGQVLDTYFPTPKLGAPPPGAASGTTAIEAHAAANLQAHSLAEAAGEHDAAPRPPGDRPDRHRRPERPARRRA